MKHKVQGKRYKSTGTQGIRYERTRTQGTKHKVKGTKAREHKAQVHKVKVIRYGAQEQKVQGKKRTKAEGTKAQEHNVQRTTHQDVSRHGRYISDNILGMFFLVVHIVRYILLILLSVTLQQSKAKLKQIS